MSPRAAIEVSWRWPGFTYGMLAAAIAREIALRERTYPGMVARGNMTRAEADEELALAQAWAADVARMIAGVPPLADPPDHPFSWARRRRAVLDELGRQERLFPRWIASGRMMPADAQAAATALRALLHRYDGGWGFRPASGATPGFGALNPTPAQRAAAAEWAAAMAAIDAETAPAQELAL